MGWKVRVGLLWCVVLLVPYSRSGELMVGAGYGEQVGSRSGQKNGIVDLIYNFYEKPWGDLHLLLGAGGTWLWTDHDSDTIFMGTVLPSVRYYFGGTRKYRPYLFLGVGPSYMSSKNLGNQRSGGRFTFNDFVGAGVQLGAEQQWSIGFCYRHISNGSLYDSNDGFDVPFTFHVSHRF